MLIRDVPGAASESYDLIIVGGGMYGAMLSLEATARGLRPLLVESRDFGGQTSFNTFRLIHGGLRYLQSMDIIRLRELVVERRWFLRHFPDLVVPVPCLMPLYRRGLRRRHVVRFALLLNDLLSRDRNSGLQPERCLPAGRIVERREVMDRCRDIDTEALECAALWWDASMPDSQRLIMEVFRWSTAAGATALNYVAAEKLLRANGKAAGIEALDSVSGRTHEFRAPVVINASGPWVRETAAQFDRDYAPLFRPTIAWNILLDKTPPCDCILALHSGRPTGQTYFLQPFKGRLLVGTGHARWNGGPENIAPTFEQNAEILDQANQLMPGLDLETPGIVRVFSGLLPGTGEAGHKLAGRPTIVDHGRKGGIQNLFSVSGVKFTSARRVAATVLDMAYAGAAVRLDISTFQPAPVPPNHWDFGTTDIDSLEKNLPGLRLLVEQESVIHLDDLVLRRTSSWENENLFPQMASKLCDLFGWSEDRRCAELQRLATAVGPAIASRQPPSGRSGAEQRRMEQE